MAIEEKEKKKLEKVRKKEEKSKYIHSYCNLDILPLIRSSYDCSVNKSENDMLLNLIPQYYYRKYLL